MNVVHPNIHSGSGVHKNVVHPDLHSVQGVHAGADPGFKKGGFNVVPKSDTVCATHNYL